MLMQGKTLHGCNARYPLQFASIPCLYSAAVQSLV